MNFNPVLLPFHIAMMIVLVMIVLDIFFFKIFNIKLSRQTLIQQKNQYHFKVSFYLFCLFAFINFALMGYLTQLVMFAYQKRFLSIYEACLVSLLLLPFPMVLLLRVIEQVIQPEQLRFSDHIIGKFARILPEKHLQNPRWQSAQTRNDLGQVEQFWLEPMNYDSTQNQHCLILDKQDDHYISLGFDGNTMYQQHRMGCCDLVSYLNQIGISMSQYYLIDVFQHDIAKNCEIRVEHIGLDWYVYAHQSNTGLFACQDESVAYQYVANYFTQKYVFNQRDKFRTVIKKDVKQSN
ncbi:MULTISPECIES: hypothetical protein [unclassified Acinetobacter]|uniref:hypothetical protein n=1 Tax=unclassified Acinetobacter TaxID=196816 RepID=UPI0035B6DDAD